MQEDDLFHTPLSTSPVPPSSPSFDQEKCFGSTKGKHLNHFPIIFKFMSFIRTNETETCITRHDGEGLFNGVSF